VDTWGWQHSWSINQGKLVLIGGEQIVLLSRAPQLKLASWKAGHCHWKPWLDKIHCWVFSWWTTCPVACMSLPFWDFEFTVLRFVHIESTDSMTMLLPTVWDEYLSQNTCIDITTNYMGIWVSQKSDRESWLHRPSREGLTQIPVSVFLELNWNYFVFTYIHTCTQWRSGLHKKLRTYTSGPLHRTQQEYTSSINK